MLSIDGEFCKICIPANLESSKVADSIIVEFTTFWIIDFDVIDHLVNHHVAKKYRASFHIKIIPHSYISSLVNKEFLAVRPHLNLTVRVDCVCNQFFCSCRAVYIKFIRWRGGANTEICHLDKSH